MARSTRWLSLSALRAVLATLLQLFVFILILMLVLCAYVHILLPRVVTVPGFPTFLFLLVFPISIFTCVFSDFHSYFHWQPEWFHFVCLLCSLCGLLHSSLAHFKTVTRVWSKKKKKLTSSSGSYKFRTGSRALKAQ